MTALSVIGPFGPLGAAKTNREASRAIEGVRAACKVAAVYDEARIEAMAEITESALLATSHISALEGLLMALTPHAETRLRHIADAGCAAMAGVVLTVGRRL